MTPIVYLSFYLICAWNIIWGALKKKSNALYGIALIVIFFLMTFNYNGPDINVYRVTYDLVGNAQSLKHAIDSTYMEYGYTFLMFCANKIGLNFYAFRIVLTLICLGLFISTVKFYKANANFVIGLYMAYLFFFDTIQLRNFIIQFIVLFASRYLLKKSGMSVLKYILCIAVAGSIHTLAWVYLSLLLVKFIKTKKGYRIVFIIGTAMFVLCVLLQPVFPQIINAIAKLLDRGSSYFHSTFRLNYWVVMVLHMVALAPLYLYRNRISDERARKIVNTILKINIIMGLFLPLSFINSNFNRIFRNVIILNTVGMTIIYESAPKHSRMKQATCAAQFLSVGGWLASDLYRNRTMDIIGDIMNYNLFYVNIEVYDILQYALVIAVCLVVVLVVKRVFADNGRSLLRGARCL